MKDIKLRIKSVESTMQITKAMELVASSKLRRAKERAESTRPYFTTLHQTLSDIAYSNTEFVSPFVQKREIKKVCCVMIAGDRGLAGGYNSNLFKTVAEAMKDQSLCVLPIGKKAVEYCAHRGIETVSDQYVSVEDLSLRDCFSIARLLCSQFREGAFDELYVGYTNFVSMLSQQPAVLKLLPVHYERPEAKVKAESLLEYEPSSQEVYDTIVPEYVGGLLWGAVAESLASELGARRTAMDAASKNAGEMIEDLSLKYNRARQGAITQEITEIVAGAEA
jgi:F-type H+-transporting ATPase subunit gamma